MKPSPDPLNRHTLTRASIAGAGLAIGGILLFFMLWFALGAADVGPFAQLRLSLCIPPALIAAAVGLFFLRTQARRD